MRRFGTVSWSYARSYAWRQLITLVCVSAFVFVAVAHAGHHIAPPGGQAAISAPAVPVDGGDDNELANEVAAADTICLFCTLAAAEIISMGAISPSRISDRVETSVFALTAWPIPAESPPPIA